MHQHSSDHEHQAGSGTRTALAEHQQAPGDNALEEYRRAFDEAQPAPGRTVVHVELDAREVDWTIAPGQTFRAWGFNGQVPGPTLEARVGDVLAVRVTNHLAESTSIHWHGLRVPAAMDGTEMVQRPISPGDSFTYRFRLPDAGTFWYHPHTHETVQMERGLYGALVVRSEGEPAFDAERVLVFDDVKLDRTGQVARFGGIVERHDGRQGGVRLVNGTREPEFEMAAGQVERWRIVNASSARYIRLSVGGRVFRIVGTDGG